jgi:hypothetical protein
MNNPINVRPTQSMASLFFFEGPSFPLVASPQEMQRKINRFSLYAETPIGQEFLDKNCKIFPTH